MRCAPRWTLPLVVWIAIAPLLNRPPAAQQRPTPSDSVPRDSVPRTGADMSPLVYAVFVAALTVAPPAVLLSSRFTDPDSTGTLGNHIAAYFAAGGMDQHGSENHGDTYSGTVEVLAGHFYGTFRASDFRGPGHVQFLSARAGYLLRAKRVLAGGVSVGYRHVTGHNVEDAVEVGLPLVLGNEIGGVRWEPSYVISSKGIAWNYRLQMELYLAKPLVLGAAFEVLPLRQGASHFNVVSLLLGLRRQ
jgi:hypothetical protein